MLEVVNLFFLPPEEGMNFAIDEVWLDRNHVAFIFKIATNLMDDDCCAVWVVVSVELNLPQVSEVPCYIFIS